MPPEEASLRDLIATGRATLVSIDRSAQAVEHAAQSVDEAATLARSSALRASYLVGLRDGALVTCVFMSLVLVLFLVFLFRRSPRA